jgi:hypothetical protein
MLNMFWPNYELILFTNIGYFSVFLNGISHQGINKVVPSHPGMLCYSRLAYASQEYALMRAFPVGICQSRMGK